jgi:cyclophilin family peptidyl-prolyl cis-trans isomerase
VGRVQGTDAKLLASASMSKPVAFALVSCLGAACLAECSAKKPLATAASADASAPANRSDLLVGIARAEDRRSAGEVPRDAANHHDPAVRRAAARAFARILGADDGPLLRALHDEDEEVVAWAGYGLGESCKGHAEYVSALAARLASLASASPSKTVPEERLGEDSGIRALPTILRAIGRCSGDAAEEVLRTWLGESRGYAQAAAFALGDVAARRGTLATETVAALLDAAQGSSPVEAALYPFGRIEPSLSQSLATRLSAAARGAMARPGPLRFFAVRALGRSGDAGAIPELAGLLSKSDSLVVERVEAVQALARFGKAGHAALSRVVGASFPAHSEEALGSGFAALLTEIGALARDLPDKTEGALWEVAGLQPPDSASPSTVRRVSTLRCAAAKALARGAWDSDVLRKCDLGDGEVGERARLEALDRGPLVRARRAAWAELARSTHLRIREAALDAIAQHPELGEMSRALLAQSLSASQPGLVATAANLVRAHPDRVFVLAASERRAALDPKAPAPTGPAARPAARELDGAVAVALRAALARPWRSDLVETRVALLDAALAVGLDEGRTYAEAACNDVNATVRSRAAKALQASGSTGASCSTPAQRADAAAEIGRERTGPVRIELDTEAGVIALRLDPTFAPVAVARLTALARSGFYLGLSFHRVVAGFVAQFGDPGGDGFGGSADLLRCETSPLPFRAGSVGVALAGRDTGSSQMFVALARYPHLDGQYTWIGQAEGAWDAVVEGDVIQAVRVEP